MTQLTETPEVILPSYEWDTLKHLLAGISPIIGVNDAYKQDIESLISQLPALSRFKMRAAIKALSFYGSSQPLTLSHKLIVNMTNEEVGAVLKMWATSPVIPLRLLFAGIKSAAVVAFCNHTKGSALYEDPVHPELAGLRESPDFIWTIPKVRIPKPLANTAASVIHADVTIVGTGCSAMVCAYQLAKAGYSVLLLEKGYHVNAMTSPDLDFKRDEESFERGGAFTSNDNSTLILAGSTVGGGGAVNWSCSLRTPEYVRNEWSRRSGVDFFSSTEYDAAMDEVERVMQVTEDVGVPNSFTNQLILDSSAKLGYPARQTGQNTGKHHPNSAFVEFGSRRGEKGGVGEFLRYACENGAQVLQRAQAHSIRHRGGRASGVNVIVNGNKELIVKSKHVVSAGGALNTPALLLRSKFTNKHIGKGLKLHPVTVAYGRFNGTRVNKRLDPIMTAVTTQPENADGLNHGPKIEAIHHQPLLLTVFLPWNSPEDYEDKVKQLPELCSLLIISRDKDRGTVTLDNRGRPTVDYTPSKFDLSALKLGSMCGANLLYVGGADRIFLSSTKVPEFVPTKPTHERSIWDKDYRDWLAEVEKAEFEIYDTQVGSAHQMASCRMSNGGPSQSAVDEKGHLYECPNVHVIDTSVFPSASGVNPMISCMSTAYILSNYLVSDLNKQQTKL